MPFTVIDLANADDGPPDALGMVGMGQVTRPVGDRQLVSSRQA